MKPEMKFENGKLKVKAAVGLDKDNDAQNSVSLAVELEIDALEAVAEITKDGVPEWLKNLLEKA